MHILYQTVRLLLFICCIFHVLVLTYFEERGKLAAENLFICFPKWASCQSFDIQDTLE